MSDTTPITLHTDASDYSVDGYLFQTVDGIDQPLAFVSKSLDKSQLLSGNEAYGLFPDKRYILVIVSTFTRLVDLYVTALLTADCLIQHFGCFGAPHQLRSKNGPYFIADEIKKFLVLIGIERCITLANSQEENAIVERFNKKINRHLRALTFDNLSLSDYRKSLPFV